VQKAKWHQQRIDHAREAAVLPLLGAGMHGNWRLMQSALEDIGLPAAAAAAAAASLPEAAAAEEATAAEPPAGRIPSIQLLIVGAGIQAEGKVSGDKTCRLMDSLLRLIP
jgi:hypothetical protein